MSSALSSLPHWAVVFMTIGIVAATVLLHYEALSWANQGLGRWHKIHQRLRILALILVLLLLHISEIWLFGFGIHLASHFPSLGAIDGMADNSLLDAIYLSATTYTTLGIGDLVPQGPIRFLIGTEAVLGLLMITWSASFTYLEMQRYWR